MNLQPKQTNITAQKEFLNTTQGLIHKVGGVTLNASAFTGDATGYLKAGSMIMIDSGSGLAVVPTFTVADVGDGLLFVTANDVDIRDGNAIVGAIESAYLNESVVTTVETGRVAVTQEFVNATNGRFHLR